MNKLLTKILLFVTLLGFTNVAGASDRWETLRAINWVENPTNQTTVGRFGELGPYQFRPGTWRMHTDKPFRQAVQRAVADEVAIKHYEWIKRTLEQRGVEASVFNIAMAWNCGVEAVLSGRAPSVSYNYAERVTNLVDTLKERVRPVMAEDKLPAARSDQWSVPEGGDTLRFRVMQDTPRFVLAAG
jgi:hypothetical protein